MKLRDVIAYGTSEGVKKEWENRERKPEEKPAEEKKPPKTIKKVPLSWWNRLSPDRQKAEIRLAEMRNQIIVPYTKR